MRSALLKYTIQENSVKYFMLYLKKRGGSYLAQQRSQSTGATQKSFIKSEDFLDGEVMRKWELGPYLN